MNKKGTKNKKCFLLIGNVLFIAFFCFLFISFMTNQEEETMQNEEVFDLPSEQKVESLQIIDSSSDTRPIAVMINNHDTARPYHSGLDDAYLLYEIIAEGGYTRYMAIFKDKTTERIGSVRSSRHYFLDYVLENDAIYVHWGWSPQAESDISSLGISNINGLIYDGKYFYRDHTLGIPLEHTGFTNMSLLQNAILRLGYRTTTKQQSLLTYSIQSVDYTSFSDVIVANHITIPYSSIVTTSYEYDSQNKVYNRYVNKEAHVDYVTKKQYTFKNIILYQVSNYSIDGYGRQNINNIDNGTGYYISEGLAVPIVWEKSSRREQTVYRLLDGSVLHVNDGNTFIQIQPKSQNYVIS